MVEQPKWADAYSKVSRGPYGESPIRSYMKELWELKKCNDCAFCKMIRMVTRSALSGYIEEVTVCDRFSLENGEVGKQISPNKKACILFKDKKEAAEEDRIANKPW